MQDIVIEGTAQDLMAQLAQMPPGERVRLVIARSSLSILAHRLQATANSNGMSNEIHHDLLKSLNHDV